MNEKYIAHKYRCDDPTCPQMLCSGTTTRFPPPSPGAGAVKEALECASDLTPMNPCRHKLCVGVLAAEVTHLIATLSALEARLAYSEGRWKPKK